MEVPDILTKSILGSELTLAPTLLCVAASLCLGMGVAVIYMFKNKYNKNFVITLALMPTIVQIVIMMVGGNIGTGIAVAGAFSLIRFRSVPGSARDIGSIFFAVALGLSTATGYVLLAALLFVILGAVNLILLTSHFGEERSSARLLKISIPENLDYDRLFDDLFEQYTEGAELDRIRTTNMGSLFELSYIIQVKGQNVPKEFIDQLRCRNGNLTITVSRQLPVTNDVL